MSRNLLAFSALAAGLWACRAPPAAAPVAKERPPVSEAAVPAPAPEPMPAVVGSLERPAALARLFEALAKLEAHELADDVRIVQLGDSHTAADWQTGPVRRSLQARFGDGGRGFVPIGRPWKAWSQEGVLTGNAGDWTTEMNQPTSRRPTGDGVFGLSGVAMATRQPGARVWTEVLVPASSIELAYLEQPGGGSFELLADGVRARISTRADAPRAAFRAAELSPSQAHHHLEVRALGDGAVRIFGAALERPEHGLVFDALGINGARVATPVSWQPEPWGEALRHRAPSLAILAYGTNDAVDAETSLDAFEAGLGEMLARVGRAAPCLVLGPPDRASQPSGEWKTTPRLGDIVARERHAAEAAGCAFYDQLAAMPGPSAAWRWGPDRVHLTREGYAKLGEAFVGDLLRAYDEWRRIDSKP
ncbi:MAG: GDSL-type esterase/lipase family protein [Labilithrix sp.]